MSRLEDLDRSWVTTIKQQPKTAPLFSNLPALNPGSLQIDVR
jgi:hypothetical protein